MCFDNNNIGKWNFWKYLRHIDRFRSLESLWNVTNTKTISIVITRIDRLAENYRIEFSNNQVQVIILFLVFNSNHNDDDDSERAHGWMANGDRDITAKCNQRSYTQITIHRYHVRSKRSKKKYIYKKFLMSANHSRIFHTTYYLQPIIIIAFGVQFFSVLYVWYVHFRFVYCDEEEDSEWARARVPAHLESKSVYVAHGQSPNIYIKRMACTPMWKEHRQSEIRKRIKWWWWWRQTKM